MPRWKAHNVAEAARSKDRTAKPPYFPRGKSNAKCRAATGLAFDADIAAERMSEVLDDRQAEPGAAQLARAGLIDAIEPLKDAVQLLSGDADPRVLALPRTISGCPGPRE